MSRARRTRVWTSIVPVLVGSLLVLAPTPTARAATLPAGFTEETLFSGLSNPTAVRFASDGRVFVAEKSGLVKVFDSVTDPTATVFADLRTNVYNFWDRGLLGLALDPSFPANPYVYVLYTYDHELGSSAPPPRWGTPGASSDGCPTPPGATGDGCVVSGRLSRLQAEGNVMAGAEQVLIEDWCQQYPSHSIGSIAFGADGALYASAGDGASFNFEDYGQDGNPLNPCGDPPGGAGAVLTPPTAEGGALRAQDLRTFGDPVTLDGAIVRVDPATGAALPTNPLAGNADPNARRIVAHGLRNPFRMVVRPGTNELWIGDVGWATWEEINRVPNPTDATVENFGWPCYEGGNAGSLRQPGYDATNLNICEGLYGQSGAVTAPFFSYNHSSKVGNEPCPVGSSSVAGLAFSFYTGGPYPPDFDGALFFADYSRDCIWSVKTTSGIPDKSRIEMFVGGAANPVDLQVSPQGELVYADLDGGTVRRIRHTAGNRAPVATATASPTSGPAPLTVNFDGSGSSDPDAGDTITHAWDLDGDGAYDDSTAVAPTFTYQQPGTYNARLRVTDNRGATGTSAPIVISAGNDAPTATISAPAAGTTWKVDDVIQFAGGATDPQQGQLPPSALSWSLILHHCPSNCHTHPIQTFTGVANGSFAAPDHEHPSHLELKLTATDAGGLTDTESVLLDPQTVALAFQSSPPGLQLTHNGSSLATPFTRTVITGSNNSIGAPSPQTLDAVSYVFQSWSDGGAQTHNVTAGAPATYTATYAPQSGTGATLRFGPEADARVHESTPGGNFGTSYLRVDAGSDPDVESYLRFTVAGASGAVQSAKLRVYAYSGTANGPAVYTASGTWSESAITWSNRPPRAGAARDDKASIPSNSWVEYDVTPLVTGNGTYTFVLAGTSSDGIDMHAREATTASLRPELVVTTGSGGGDDTTPPDTTITAGPSGTVTSPSASFSFTSTEAGSTFACSLDGAAFSACSSPISYATLANGQHTFQVRATDAAGNTDATPASRTWSVSAPAGTTLRFGAAADARVHESTPGANFATSYLRVDAGSDPDVESYLRFTVAGTSGAVQSAKLRVYAYTGTANGPAVFSGGTATWSESAITWSNRPPRAGPARDDKASIPSNSWVEYDVTPMVTGNGTYTFVLAGTSSDGIDIHAREATTASLRPELVVTTG